MKFTNSIFTSMCIAVLTLLLTISSFAQAPEKMSYQAVIRDADNALVTSQEVGMQISILQGDVAVYEETQTPTSNTNGLVSLEIGTGTVISGSFTAIDWSVDTSFITIETDPTGGTNYTITGTSQLLSVPYALYAKTSSDASAVAVNSDKVGYTEVLVSANTDVAANTAKTGITSEQTSAITANTAKTGISSGQSDAITANTSKVGYTEALVSANTDVAANTAKTGITDAQSGAITTNTAKVSYSDAAAAAVALNTAKTVITSEQSDAIIANTTKTNPWSVNAANDSISYEKKVVIGSLTNINVPALTVYGTNIGSPSPSANFIRSRYRNNVLGFETSEENNSYKGSIGLLEGGENGSWSNSFAIGINDGLDWYSPLRIYYNNKAIRFGFGSDNYFDPNTFGNSSLSLGLNSFATGDFSSTLGVENAASGDYSTAMGFNTEASGQFSTAIGFYTEASDYASFVIGQHNAAGATVTNSATAFNPNNTAFVIGNGGDENNKSDALKVLFNGNTTILGDLELGGDVIATGFSTTSDARLKKNIEPLTQALDKVMELNPVSYLKKKIISDSSYPIVENGFIAQEIQKVMPKLVRVGADNDKIMSVNYIAIIPLLTKAMQEQQKAMEEQQKEIDELKKMIKQLMSSK